MQLLHISCNIEEITSVSHQQLVPIVLGHGQPPRFNLYIVLGLTEPFNQGPLLCVCMLYVHVICKGGFMHVWIWKCTSILWAYYAGVYINYVY